MARKPKDPKAPKRRRFDLHKALFVLPNAFTAASILCGFIAILSCASAVDDTAYYKAAVAIFYGTLFDMFDGRVARLTRTQSEFGREFDSLADVITFGVAPGVLVFKWALSGLGMGGTLLSFAFAACGAIRLARFNVLAVRDPHGSSKHFVGLPIPLAAAGLVSVVMARHNTGVEITTQTVVVLVLMLSFLMVSTVKYRTFKELKMTRKSVSVLVTLLLLIIYFSYVTFPSLVMMAFVWGYIVVGMVAEVLFFKKRRAAAQLEAEAKQAAAEAAAAAVTGAVTAGVTAEPAKPV